MNCFFLYHINATIIMRGKSCDADAIICLRVIEIAYVRPHTLALERGATSVVQASSTYIMYIIHHHHQVKLKACLAPNN